MRRYLLSHADLSRRSGAVHGEHQPAWLLDSCGPNASIANFSLESCGELYGMYNNFFVTSVHWWRSAPVQRFLRYVDASGLIYTRRYGDLLLQSVAVQIFLPKSKVKMFDSFTYEHSTRIPRASYLARVAEQMTMKRERGASSSGSSVDDLVDTRGGDARDTSRHLARVQRRRIALQKSNSTDDCIDFGGIAAGTDDARGYDAVIALVRSHTFCRPPCVRVFLHRGRLIAAATAGSVKVEQHDCTQSPPAHHCFATVDAVAGALAEGNHSYKPQISTVAHSKMSTYAKAMAAWRAQGGATSSVVAIAISRWARAATAASTLGTYAHCCIVPLRI